MARGPNVRSDPSRREELLAIVRAHPRSTKAQIAGRMHLSPSCVRELIVLLEREGLVKSEIDITARTTPRSGAPLVVWIPRKQARIGKPKLPRAIGIRQVSLKRDWRYAPTGTLADGVAVQVFAVAGR